MWSPVSQNGHKYYLKTQRVQKYTIPQRVKQINSQINLQSKQTVLYKQINPWSNPKNNNKLVVCIKASQQSIRAGGVPVHYSNFAAATLE